jgi:SAM-dependent methyltransferase
MKEGNGKCGDERCLFDGDGGVREASMESVTEDTREGKGLWQRCNHCGLVINRSGVAPDQVDSFYNQTYQEKNSFFQGKKIDARQHFEIRLESIKPRAEYLLSKINRNARVFELGAGSGELLHLLKPHVSHCVANELCREFVDFMNDELGIEASSGDYLQMIPEKPWNLAISIATLDHIHNPRSVLEKLYLDTAPGGLLYVEVPNDLQALKEFLPGEHAREFRRYMYQAAHYYSFTFDTLGKLLSDAGFVVEESFSRHDYSLMNFLNWFFIGKPQKSIGEAKSSSMVFTGESGFEQEMNALLAKTDERFHEIINRHKCGESICMLARKS